MFANAMQSRLLVCFCCECNLFSKVVFTTYVAHSYIKMCDKNILYSLIMVIKYKINTK